MPAELNDYSALAGKRLAVVESMLHHPYYLGLRQARERGLHVRLLIGDRDWYTHGQDWDSHPLAEADEVVEVDTSDVDAVVAAVTDAHGALEVDGICSYSDYHTVVAAEAARRLGLPGPDPGAVATANHKDRLRVALGDVPWNIPHRLVGDAARARGGGRAARLPAHRQAPGRGHQLRRRPGGHHGPAPRGLRRPVPDPAQPARPAAHR